LGYPWSILGVSLDGAYDSLRRERERERERQRERQRESTPGAAPPSSSTPVPLVCTSSTRCSSARNTSPASWSRVPCRCSTARAGAAPPRSTAGPAVLRRAAPPVRPDQRTHHATPMTAHPIVCTAHPPPVDGTVAGHQQHGTPPVRLVCCAARAAAHVRPPCRRGGALPAARALPRRHARMPSVRLALCLRRRARGRACPPRVPHAPWALSSGSIWRPWGKRIEHMPTQFMAGGSLNPWGWGRQATAGRGGGASGSGARVTGAAVGPAQTAQRAADDGIDGTAGGAPLWGIRVLLPPLAAAALWRDRVRGETDTRRRCRRARGPLRAPGAAGPHPGSSLRRGARRGRQRGAWGAGPGRDRHAWDTSSTLVVRTGTKSAGVSEPGGSRTMSAVQSTNSAVRMCPAWPRTQ
jgi:hypothetical protein